MTSNQVSHLLGAYEALSKQGKAIWNLSVPSRTNKNCWMQPPGFVHVLFVMSTSRAAGFSTSPVPVNVKQKRYKLKQLHAAIIKRKRKDGSTPTYSPIYPSSAGYAQIHISKGAMSGGFRWHKVTCWLCYLKREHTVFWKHTCHVLDACTKSFPRLTSLKINYAHSQSKLAIDSAYWPSYDVPNLSPQKSFR